MYRLVTCLAALVGTISLASVGASAQCIISNPSFEIGGSGAQVFGGWNQFGVVGSTSNAPHGSLAARVTGPNSGKWDVSAYWQEFDTAPGEQWEASVQVWHTPVNPLTGQSKAILNIEWRDIADSLISYESHDVATASTPLDEIQEFNVVSGPAPAGSVKTHLLLAVLQSPTDPPPDVYYDLAQFNEIGPPSIDDLQWNDFPGGRTISFSGYDWRVKGPGVFGPGPNRFDDAVDAVWVDSGGQLHMTIQNNFGNWFSTEIAPVDPLGYGDYIFTTEGRLDLLDPNAVLGLFIWEYGPCYDPAQVWWNPYNEFDIEFSRWGNPGSDIGQFVAQPWDWPGNISRFDAAFVDGEITSHAIRWLPDRVECRSWRGGPQDESTSVQIYSWTYTGPHIPRPEQPRVHINLWHINAPASDQEVILDAFTFVPVGGPPSAAADTPVAVKSYLADARPNPFNPTTSIGYTMVTDGFAEIVVYDVRGKLVRTLVSGNAAAGFNEVIWDGRNDSGDRVASGVYLYQLRTGSVVETKKMVMLK
jgi:hypothetical protein